MTVLMRSSQHFNPFMRKVEKDQTYFKNLAVLTPQDFYSMFGNFLTLWMKGLNDVKKDVKKSRILTSAFRTLPKNYGGAFLQK